MGDWDMEDENWKDSKKKTGTKKEKETKSASSIKSRGCSKADRVPGIMVLDERVIKLLRDVELRSAEQSTFAKGLENWQWMIFVKWHLGIYAELANRYTLSENRLATKLAGDRWQFASPSRGMSYYVDHAKCKEMLPKKIVELIVAGDRRGAQEALQKAMKK